MKIRDILAGKDSTGVVSIAPDASVAAAIAMLVRHDIGAVVVASGDAISGILSERDVLRAAAEDAQRLGTASVRDLMTSNVVTASPEADIQEVMHIMTERRFRHLPVVEHGRLCGMVSIGDVVNALRRSVEDENRHLHAYIHGTTR
jgi:CBS domain-containing protein